MESRYFVFYVFNTACAWDFISGGWDMDGVEEMISAKYQLPVGYWMWSSTTQQWTWSVVHRERKPAFCRLNL